MRRLAQPRLTMGCAGQGGLCGGSMNKLGLAVCAGLVATPAHAADWRIVSWNDEFVLYLDHEAIRRDGASASYQSKILYLKDPVLAELQARVEMRCDKQEYRNLEVWALSRTGGLEATRVAKSWRKLEPGTNIEREFVIVCAAGAVPTAR